MKLLKIAAVALVVLFAGIQAIRPERDNPAFDEARTIQASLQVPPEVDAILRRSCYDCHSSETSWPWYSHVAPVSWLVAADVSEGRQALTFSDWGGYTKSTAARKLREMCELVREGEMPLENYLLLHPSARLSEAEVETLCNWAMQERERLRAEVRDESQ